MQKTFRIPGNLPLKEKIKLAAEKVKKAEQELATSTKEGKTLKVKLLSYKETRDEEILVYDFTWISST